MTSYSRIVDLYNDTPLSASKTDNWVAKVGGLPPMVRAIARALMRTGKSESDAIATAIAAVKRWAAGAGGVKPATRARAAAAVAHWEASKAAAHAKSGANLSTPMQATTDSPTLTVAGHMRAIRRLAAAHKTASPSQRPKLKAAMTGHAKAIQKMRGK